jgi:hypothetical protein
MRFASAAGLAGALCGTAAVVGAPALVGATVTVVFVVGVYCWTITSRERTANAVEIITALRRPIPSRAGQRHQRQPGPRRR